MIHTLLFYFTTLISKIGKNLIYTILSILTINYFNKKIIKINNYLDRKYISSTFTFNLHYFMTRIIKSKSKKYTKFIPYFIFRK
jgi:hypothetical protein